MTTTTYNRENSRVLPDFLTRVSSRVVNYVSRTRAERQLLALDDRLLADIGMRRSEIRRMVLRGASATELRDMAVEEGMLTLRMDGIVKIQKGVTTLEEVVKETAG